MPRFAAGDRVECPYGPGTVRRVLAAKRLRGGGWSDVDYVVRVDRDRCDYCLGEGMLWTPAPAGEGGPPA